MNLADNLERSALYFPDRSVIIEEDREVSYRELNQESSRVATALLCLGVQPGEHVAICAPNSYQWVAFYFGVLKAGGVAVTLSINLVSAELMNLLNDAHPKILLTVDEKLNDLGDRQNYAYLEKIVSPGGDISYERLVKMGSSSFRPIDRDRKDTAAILYTGGTTGIPKGTMLTHENMQTSTHNICYFERSTYEDRALCFLPLNHVFAQIHIMHSMIYAGGAIMIQPSFDLDKVVEAIRLKRITKFYGVPTIYIRLLQIEGLKKKLEMVRYCFSAASSMAAKLVREWKSRVGLDIHEAYGMTETAAMTTYNHYLRHVIGSVGTPVNTNAVKALSNIVLVITLILGC